MCSVVLCHTKGFGFSFRSSPRLDVGGELFDGAVGGALELLCGQRRGPPLDQVHPRAVGRGEVEVEPAMTQQPLVDGRGLVRREVVQDHVHVEVLGDLPVDLVYPDRRALPTTETAAASGAGGR